MNFSKIFSWGLAALSFLLPLFFLTYTTDFYNFNKTVLLYYGTSLLFVGWIAKVLVTKEVSWRKTHYQWPVVGFMLVFLLSTLIQAPNRWMALANSSGLFLALGALYLFIVNNLKEETKATLWILTSLISASFILAWILIFSYLGINERLPWDWIKTKAWTPTGSPLTTLSFIAILIPGTLYWAFKTKKANAKILLFLAGSVQVLSVLLLGSLFVNKTLSFVYLPPKFGWQISVEGLKSIRTALLGVGPGNYITAFNLFRSAGLNATGLWNAKFGSSTNEFFQLLSTVGVLGLASYLIIVFKSIKRENWRGSLINKVLYLTLITAFISQLLIPSSLLIWMLVFIALALKQLQLEEDNVVKSNTQPVVFGFVGICALLVLPVLYFPGRLWMADNYFRQSLVAANENKGIDTYNLQVKTLSLNPYSENYRLAYASTNFALANSLASKGDLSDQDRQNITQLISQSIREAKAVTSLNPGNSAYWQNLAVIYRNIINVAEGADQWALAAYLQAIATDPTNPLLRVDFGGLYYALGDLDRAIEQFRIAANLKQDYANAYYNLAASYKAKQDWPRAYENMQLAINFVPADSPDLTTALAELEEIKKNLPAPPEAQTGKEVAPEEKLAQPSPIPSPQQGFGNITLPEEAAPEIPPVTASPEAQTNPSPQVLVSPTPAQ